MATRLETPGTRAAITLDLTIRLLQDQGALSAAQAQQVKKSVNLDDTRHPFVQLADLGLRATGANRDPLTLENITRLVAGACHMDYFCIDPLKINVEAVTALVSQAYATRFQFLPVLVNEQEVTIATGEPFANEWEPEIARVLKRKITRVLANPRDV